MGLANADIPLLLAGVPHELPGGLRRHRIAVLPGLVLRHQRDQQHRHLAVRRALRPHVRGRREPGRRAELHGAGPGPLPDWASAAVCGALLADPGPYMRSMGYGSGRGVEWLTTIGIVGDPALPRGRQRDGQHLAAVIDEIYHDMTE